MTLEEKQRALKKVFWDYEFSWEELQNILQGKIHRIGHLDKQGLYARLLSSLNWYVILELIGKEHLNDLLSDNAIGSVATPQ